MNQRKVSQLFSMWSLDFDLFESPTSDESGYKELARNQRNGRIFFFQTVRAAFDTLGEGWSKEESNLAFL